ncbi:MAG: gluconeogenesis factor YvcK family protein [Candidatus Gottesmanbacteria bacterium]
MITKPKIVCIGGGTGTFVTLRGLKNYPCSISAVVTMSDSGGSNRRIRDEFGLLPTSDIRQCLVALSEENGGVGLLRKLFMYRFEKGEGLCGMTFGNLFMAALTDILGSQEEAIKQTGKVLRIHGNIIPVSFTNTQLCARYENDQYVSGEHLIDEPSHDGKLKIINIYLKPKAIANPEAVKAIDEAQLIVLGPGDLYTSLIPNLLVNGIINSLKRSKAKIVYIMNLMTKYGQTYNFKASDHIQILENYTGKSIDYIIMSNSSIRKSILDVYAKYKEYPVIDDLSKPSYYKVIRADITSRITYEKSKADVLSRSLVRHDSRKLADIIFSLLKK